MNHLPSFRDRSALGAKLNAWLTGLLGAEIPKQFFLPMPNIKGTVEQQVSLAGLVWWHRPSQSNECRKWKAKLNFVIGLQKFMGPIPMHVRILTLKTSSYRASSDMFLTSGPDPVTSGPNKALHLLYNYILEVFLKYEVLFNKTYPTSKFTKNISAGLLDFEAISL